MKNLLEELLVIMDQECANCKEWQENKPLIINIYVEGDE